MIAVLDIFFHQNYGKLAETIQGGTSEVYLHQSPFGTIRHLFIKQPIQKINGTTYYRLITPFRYGGPLILTYQRGKKEELVQDFAKAFQNYCFENKIISEFVRFHPLSRNWEDFDGCYNIRFSRYTVGTNLQAHVDPISREFSKSARRNIKKALDFGLRARVVRGPEDLTSFQRIYYETLDRNKGAAFNYFSQDYFTACLKYFRQNLILTEVLHQRQVIAASLSFASGNTIHIHLSGTLTAYLHLSPAYLLRFALVRWGKKKGYHLVHHGGGLTPEQDDSLYQFKQRFGTLRFPFKVGNRVWDNSSVNLLE